MRQPQNWQRWTSSTLLRLPESGVTEPSNGASLRDTLRTRLPTGGLEESVRPEPCRRSSRKHRKGKHLSFSPLPTFTLSWLNVSGSQSAGEFGKCSCPVKGRARERWKWVGGQTGSWPACWSATLIESCFMLPLINFCFFSVNRAVHLSHLFQDKDFFKNVRELQTLYPEKLHIILLMFPETYWGILN